MTTQPAHGSDVRRGPAVDLRVVPCDPEDLQEIDPIRDGAAHRAVPLLRVVGEDDGAYVVVGRWSITVSGTAADVTAEVAGVWSAAAGWAPVTLEQAPPVATSLRLTSVHPGSPPQELDAAAAAQWWAAAVSKDAAERSRNAVADLRRVRYRLESSLAGEMRPGARDSVLPTLAALLELNVVAGRARDQARAAVRSGLLLWRTDGEAYHAYRRAQDPTLLVSQPPADAGTRPWMRTHDAGVRQCRAMEQELGEESAVIAGLLGAAATVAAAREAETQGVFTTLLGVAALGLGIPALLLSLYGVDRLVPLSTWRQVIAMLPVALTAGAAGFAAVRLLPSKRHRKRTAAAVAGVIAVLVLAAVIAPGAA